MPYINIEERAKVDEMLQKLKSVLYNNYVEASEDEKKLDGVLNYVISTLIKELYPKNYYSLNRAIGILENVKQEFYRRIVAPYEDEKIVENGDVY